MSQKGKVIHCRDEVVSCERDATTESRVVAYLDRTREEFVAAIEAARPLGEAGRGVLAGPLAKRPHSKKKPPER